MADWKWLWLCSLVCFLIKPGFADGRLKGRSTRRAAIQNKGALASSSASRTNEAKPSIQHPAPLHYFDPAKGIQEPKQIKLSEDKKVHSQLDLQAKKFSNPQSHLYSDSTTTPPDPNVYRNEDMESEHGLYRGANFPPEIFFDDKFSSPLETAKLKGSELTSSLALENAMFKGSELSSPLAVDNAMLKRSEWSSPVTLDNAMFKGSEWSSPLALDNAMFKGSELSSSLDMPNYNFQLPSNFDFGQNLNPFSSRQQGMSSRKRGGNVNDIKGLIRDGMEYAKNAIKGGNKSQGKKTDARYGYYADGTARKHPQRQDMVEKILKENGVLGKNDIQPDNMFSKFRNYGGAYGNNFMSSDWNLTPSLSSVGGFNNLYSKSLFPGMMQSPFINSRSSIPEVQYRMSEDEEEPGDEQDEVLYRIATDEDEPGDGNDEVLYRIATDGEEPESDQDETKRKKRSPQWLFGQPRTKTETLSAQKKRKTCGNIGLLGIPLLTCGMNCKTDKFDERSVTENDPPCMPPPPPPPFAVGYAPPPLPVPGFIPQAEVMVGMPAPPPLQG